MKLKVIVLIIMLLPLALAAQDNLKKVAILKTVDAEGNVPYGVKLQLRSSLTYAISHMPGYEAYDRVDMASIMDEQNFQRTGMVSDTQIKKIGEMTGASYVLVAEAAIYDASHIIITAKILDVQTAGIKEAADPEISSTDPKEMKEACIQIARTLLKSNGGGSSSPYKGELQLPEGRYVGEILAGKPHGKGVIYYKSDNSKNRVSYDGDWVNGNPEGKGVMTWSDGSKYDGNWVNDKKEGYGVETFNGLKYEGNYKDGNMNGQGTLYLAEGAKYIGNFKDGTVDGYGTSYYSDGSIEYEGSWANNQFNGNGTRYFNEGNASYKFVGNFKDGKCEGYFTVYIISGPYAGEKMTGNYVNGQEDGTFTFYDVNGKVRRHEVYKNGIQVRTY